MIGQNVRESVKESIVIKIKKVIGIYLLTLIFLVSAIGCDKKEGLNYFQKAVQRERELVKIQGYVDLPGGRVYTDDLYPKSSQVFDDELNEIGR